MRKFLLAILAIILLPSLLLAADLKWDFPSDWTDITGYTVYFTDGTEGFNKSFTKSEAVQDGVTVTYHNAEDKLNLQFNIQYSLYLAAYNDAGESGFSNTITYTRSAYVPPLDHLPPVVVGSPQSPSGLGTN